ncbi:MAG TPA: glycoside hydrolase family 97 catalytic domain-containing protein, partial [Spirochaetota bacterium]|nr:glycoside hydrolase family 97 catalytic domain-containing protein [Spirochaetota bacterium]
KPGKAAWDWWNLHDITGVDFKTGFNTRTYLYYIDFAARYGLKYVIMDEGWSAKGDITKPVTTIDLGEVVRYAKKKGIGIILWTDWKNIDRNPDEIMKKYRSWGIRGIKVDFMNRDDQSMTRFFCRIAEKAAKNGLVVDFHGAAPPPGLSAEYPNVLTGEGVKGLEHNKFSDKCTPDNDVYIPFLRMFSGAVDYTPGAMRNCNRKDFHVSYDHPSSIGTRVHQMALYTVFESPLSIMADSPARYIREDECARFISAVPVTWDDTVVCAAEIGRMICIARRKGSVWHIGAITNGRFSDMRIDLSFLESGRTYNAEIFSDGINAERNAEDYRKKSSVVRKGSVLDIHLAPGGGWTCRIR